jgi:hypothetical protein
MLDEPRQQRAWRSNGILEATEATMIRRRRERGKERTRVIEGTAEQTSVRRRDEKWA